MMQPGGAGGNGNSVGSGASQLERTQSQYQRKLARRQQLDMMEAAAAGTVLGTDTTTMTADTNATYEPPEIQAAPQQPPAPDFFDTVVVPPPGTPDGLRSRETARRFLYDEDDADLDSHIMKTNATTPITGIAAKELFQKPDNNPNAGVNLMDHSAADYKTKTPSYIRHPYEPTSTSSSSSFTKRLGQYLYPVTTGTEKEGIMTDDGYFVTPEKRRTGPTIWSTIWNDPKKRRRLWYLLGMIIFVIVLSVSLKHMNSIIPDEAAQQAKVRQYNTDRFNAMMDIMLQSGTTQADQLQAHDGVEYMALRWIAYVDPAQLDPNDPSLTPAIIQRYAMAVFYYDSYAEFQQHYGQQASIGNLTNHDEQTIGIPNPGWTRKDYWMSEKGICMWYGVHCDEQIVDGKRITQYDANGNVTSIILTGNNVYGSLPRELVAFNHLLTIDLSMNQLRESIPYHVGDLYHLQYLYLQNNQLTGTLSTRLGQMYSLLEFSLSNNYLNGTIPKEFDRLYKIKTLSLDYNHFTGGIPDLSSCTQLINLFINNNQFGGFFPYETSLMTSLVQLHMNDNEFTGTLPGELGSLSNLISLKVSNNKLTGEIPDYLFRNMNNLREFYCDNNLLTGNIPTSLETLQKVHTFSLHHNRIISSIPPAIGNMVSLIKLYLYNNKLTGSIPTTIGTLGVIEEFWLNDNMLTGPIPNEIGNLRHLETLYLENNQLSYDIPTSLGNLRSLKTLKFYNNNIVGTMPSLICSLRTDTMSSLKYIAADCYSNATMSPQIVCPSKCCDKCVV